MQENWKQIVEKFGDGLFIFAAFIGGIIGSFVDDAKVL